jgi:hypothetical protein
LPRRQPAQRSETIECNLLPNVPPGKKAAQMLDSRSLLPARFRRRYREKHAPEKAWCSSLGDQQHQRQCDFCHYKRVPRQPMTAYARHMQRRYLQRVDEVRARQR